MGIQDSRCHDVSVSVIIPVYNDTEGIRTTLDSLISQTYGDYEVIPVDNDSTDHTKDVIREFEDEYPSLVRACEETDIQSSYAARNTGIEVASGDVIMFIDSDMWVEEDWITEIVCEIKDEDCDYLGCNVEVVSEGEYPSFWERYGRSLSFPVEEYLTNQHFAPTCALATRSEVLEEVGVFDQRLISGGDKEFGQRVHRAGFEQHYTDDVTAFHPARNSWSDLRSKAIRVGRGSVQIRRYHPEIEDQHHPLHPIRYVPPSPIRLYRTYSGEDVSLMDLIGFYVLSYLLKLYETYGMIQESRK